MTVPTLTPKRAELFHHLNEVTAWPGGDITRRAMGRNWRVNADMTWLLNAGLAELNPDNEDLHLKDYRPTEAGREWLATHDENGNPR